MKSLSVSVNYVEYAVSETDAILLLGIASRMKRIKRPEGRYSGPYQISEEQEPFIDGASIVEIEEPEPKKEKLDAFTAVTREVGL